MSGVNSVNTAGVIVLGSLIVVYLTGISTTQTWNYFRIYHDDPPYLKLLVGGLCLLDNAHTVMIAWEIFYYFVGIFGGASLNPGLTPVLPAIVCVEVISTFVVQTFYCIRVYHMTRNIRVALPCWLIVLARLIVGMCLVVSIIRDTHVVSLLELNHVADTLFILVNIFPVVADVIVTTCICVIILRMRSGSGLASTNRVVDKVVAFTIGSGLLTSIMAIATLITYLTMTNLIYMALDIITAKLYVTSVITSLNERHYLRAALQKPRELSNLWFGASFNRGYMGSTRLNFEQRSAVGLNIGSGPSVIDDGPDADADATPTKAKLSNL